VTNEELHTRVALRLRHVRARVLGYGVGMATKAQAFRVQQQRAANPPKPKRPRRPRRDQVIDTAKAGVSATDRKAVRGPKLLAGRRGGAALEKTTGKPSRKSTRKSSNRTKRTTNQQLRAERKISSSTARATRASARANPARGRTRTSRR